MQLPDTNSWMIRAGRDGTVLHRFLDEGIAYVGWGEAGVVYPETAREELRARVSRAHPMFTLGRVRNAARCICEFCLEVQVGDSVITYDPQQRLYHVGLVKSDANCQTVIWVDRATGEDVNEPGYVRQIDWVSTLSRDSLSQTARNSLGRPPTHFQLPTAVSAEIRRLCA